MTRRRGADGRASTMVSVLGKPVLPRYRVAGASARKSAKSAHPNRRPIVWLMEGAVSPPEQPFSDVS